MGKTPSKENRRAGQTSAEKGASPQRRLQFHSPEREPEVGNSREVRELIRELDSGAHDKVALLKMIVIKCSDAENGYKKIR